MERLQKILKAKTYLECLAHSIDPITKQAIDDSTLQKQEIKDTLQYIVSLLDELIMNNGEVINVITPIEFQIEKIDKNLITVSDQPIQISGLVKRINRQIDKTKMGSFKQSVLTEWLLQNGYLNKDKKPVLKNVIVYSTTEASNDIGIIEQDRIDAETGEIKKSVVLTKLAQEFIVNNLENIIGITEEIKPPKDSNNYQELNMAGQKWTEQEQETLIHEFTEEELTLEQIASLHHRKVGGIRARLKKLGLIED
ncbi:MAG: hypothetical protein NC311_12960 [Muribaculaceae bacterium]|nr:hypothetical protein [Muribaculaceae bacterium]MCM1532664.1 hypothetical protein [Ruminococcus flavefaciens]